MSSSSVSVPRDANRVAMLGGTSLSDGSTPVSIYADPSTHALRVSIVGGGGSGGTSSTDNTTFTAGSTAGTPMMGEYTSGGATAITSGNVGILAATSARGLQVAAFDSAGNDATDTTNHAFRVSIVSGGGSGGTSLADNAAFTAGTTSITPIGGFYHSTIDTVTDGHSAAVAIDSKRNLFSVIRDAAGNARGANVNASNQLSVSIDGSTGTVAVTQSTSPWIVAGGGTAGSAATGIVTVQGIASMTPVQVSQATAANLNATVVGTGTFAVQAAQSGNWTARIVGNGGAVLDGVNTAATAPANGVLGLGIYNSTEPSPTTGQSVGIQLDSKGRQRQVIMDAAGNTRGANVNASNQLSVSIDGSTASNISTNVAQWGGTNVVTAGVNGMVAVGGNTATNVAITANPVLQGAQAISTENTAVTATRGVQLVADLTGKQIVMPYANKENFVSGTASATGTSGTSVISAQGAGVKIYVTSISVANTGSSTSLITIQSDPAGTPTTLWQTISPAGGGSNFTFPVPLVVPANKAVGFTAGTGSTTQYVSIAGYIGS